MMLKFALFEAAGISFILCCSTMTRETSAFIPHIRLHNSHHLQDRGSSLSVPAPTTTTRSTETSIFLQSEKKSNKRQENVKIDDGNSNNKEGKSTKKRKKKNMVTIGTLVQNMSNDAETTLYRSDKVKRKRSRRRSSAPQQTYIYAAQRKSIEKDGKTKKNTEGGDDNEEDDDQEKEVTIERQKIDKNSPIELARTLGMNPAAQFCSEQSTLVLGLDDSEDSRIDVGRPQPRIVGELRVGGDDDGDEKSNGSSTGRFAYILDKPAGWSILEIKKKKKNANKQQHQSQEEGDKSRVVAAAELGELAQTAPLSGDGGESAKLKKQHKKRVKYFDNDSGKFEWVEYNELDILSVMSPEEIAEFEKEGGLEGLNLSLNDSSARKAKIAADTVAKDARTDYEDIESFVDEVDTTRLQNEKESSVGSNDAFISSSSVASTSVTAIFSPPSRPSLMAWLKDTKAAEGTTVRGGNNWRALAGAIDIDDSGLVLLCPKEKEDNVHVDGADYVAVVGNGNCLAPKGNKKKRVRNVSLKDNDESKLEVLSRIRKGRGDDIITSSKISIPDGSSTCNDAVQLCQKEYQDGVRGDPAANPLDRRANRRLVHCSELSVSSLSQDDFVSAQCELPDDIRILSDRRNNHEFKDGSFLGRRSLKDDDSTTAYREINGAADGFPGWIVDRYGQWLLVQHDEDAERGPLPSIHDGNTLGVYYFATNRDRSIMKGVKPILLEGQPAPDIVEVKENGITYHISFEDLSTGIFLDQRYQRAWLAKHCTDETRVLNCFSHCGAFSVAAATAGAQTVNLDLSKKWLDRIKPQMEVNGIESESFDERHDCIYGDCFDWLARLAKRGEKYDIVIVDPPSTSVGGKKKKRWSAKKDYGELVTLASKLVKDGGLLWTTTNSATISPTVFARMCEKGLANAGIMSAKLEKVAPMPIDFPTIGSPPVKNFIWRMP